MTWTEWMMAAGQTALVVAVCFILLCLLTSLIRFQLMSEQALEAEELGGNEERDFRMVVVSQIAAARRARRPISVALIRLPEGSPPHSDIEAFIRPLIRAGDVALGCGENLMGLLLQCGSENAEIPIRRIADKARTAGLAGAEAWRVGVAGYPEHGFKTSVLYPRALDMIGEASERNQLVAGMAPKEEVAEAVEQAPAASVDPLTGLIAEDKMISVMRRFVAMERRQDRHVSLVYLDVDQPERLLNQYGREPVDAMLKELASRLDQGIRETDIIARFGDMGFVIAMSAHPDAAVMVAQRIMSDVRKSAFKAGNGMKVSLSSGVAGYPDVIGTVVQYFVAAETALRAARARGRNQCVKYDRHLKTPEESAASVDQI